MALEQQLEHVPVLRALDERRAQGRPHPEAVTDVDVLEGPHGIEQLDQRRIHAGRPQVTRQLDDTSDDRVALIAATTLTCRPSLRNTILIAHRCS